jgi:two-component system, NtrC family, response regulator AtoC
MASILIVDDEPRLREALTLLLKREGYAVEVADSGEAAERLFAKARFDAVVLRRAFTDARTRRLGHFETADGGTLFLDEVGDLPADVQAKLLRVLEEGKVQRLGSSLLVPVDVRIVAATHRDLEADVSAGRFREDLYWRLSQFPIRMPPLRERREDLPLLVAHLIRTFNAEFGRRVENVSPEVFAWMQQHDWPGNVRELATVIRWGLLVADGPLVGERDLRELPSYAPGARADTASDEQVRSLKDALKRSAEHVERTAIEAAMSAHQGRRTQAAAALGMTRRALFNKLRQYGLEDRWPVRKPE